MTAAIETDNLTKCYSALRAVDGLSLCVNPGEIYAFLGLNGAGKTTTIRMLLGMIKPTTGAAALLGTVVRRGQNGLWHNVGFLVETPHAYPELTVRENLEAIRQLRPGTFPSAVSHIIEQLGLARYADRRAGTLSLGNAQRLGLAKALLHSPQLLILDEPANGLDPAGIVEIRNLLIELATEQGVTVFLSSHILGEVARLAHRIGIIHEGRLVQELDQAALERNRHRRLLVRSHDLPATRALLQETGFATEVMPTGDIAVRDKTAIDQPDQVAVKLVNAGLAPTRLLVEQEDLEEYFLRLVGS